MTDRQTDKICPQISVIIPIYNCGKNKDFLRLLNSLAAQKFANFEVLLCDDGSEDDTSNICQDFQNRDNRFRYIPNEHSGVSATRNIGIDNAFGEYILFIDADDYITDSYLCDMYNVAVQNGNVHSDIVFGSYAIIEHQITLKIFEPFFVLGKEQIKVKLKQSQLLQRCSPWGKLFKRSIIETFALRFDRRLSHSEDRHFVYRYLQHVQSISTTSSIGYLYGSFNPGSLKHRPLPIEQLILRQKLLTEGAKTLCNVFDIDYQEVKPIVINLLNLYKDAINRLPNEKAQRNFYNECISESLLLPITSSTCLQSIIANDKQTKELLNGYFRGLNLHLHVIGIKRRLYNLLHKSPNKIGSFETKIDFLK